MAVYTHLSNKALRRHLRPFRVGRLVSAKGVSAGTINTIYDVTTTKGHFILRILEDRSRTDALFEEALLLHLAEHELPVPMMVRAGRRGCVLPLSDRQQLSLFHFLPGREIGVFEVDPEHARQVGRFLAEMHLAGRGFRRRRRSRYDPPRIRRVLEHSLKVLEPPRLRRDAKTLLTEMRTHAWAKTLPAGIIHSDMFIDNVRFTRGGLCGVLDFEMACNGPLVYDLAVALSDWCFLHDEFLPDNALALVEGYEEARMLTKGERSSLYALTRCATARFAATRIYDFEVQTRPDAQRIYKDYRHFMTRLRALRQLGARGFRRQVLPMRRTLVGKSSTV